MSHLKPMNKDIIFRFVEQVSKDGTFKEGTDWGFEILDNPSTGGDEHRLATVVATGPSCKQVKPGMTVIIEALMWTNQFNIDNVQHWKTDESKILAVVNDK